MFAPARPPARPRRYPLPLAAGAALLAACRMATAGSDLSAERPDRLPEPVRAALVRAGIAPSSLSLWVAPAEGGPPEATWRANPAVQPASLMKLVTSATALHRLGVTHQWTTEIQLERAPARGVLNGHLYLKGHGDPRLSPERLSMLMDQWRLMGVQDIRGDIVLDRSAYALPARSAADFDQRPLEPYNVLPDALNINHQSLILRIRPLPGATVAQVQLDPPRSGRTVDATVPMTDGECKDWRADLKPRFEAPDRVQFDGRFPRRCGERQWPLADSDPAGYAARAIETQWRASGGQLSGKVRDGLAPVSPAALRPGEPLEDDPLHATFRSPPLPEVLRDMNKYSHNTMAQQVLLALSPQEPASFEQARAVAGEVLEREVGCSAQEYVIDNGSGLSRQERLSARCLGEMLRWSWRQPWMPELLSSLPVAGREATARRLSGARGWAHLKTGSLANVSGIAGIVHRPDGRRAILVAIFNNAGASASATRSVFDALLQWTAPGIDTASPSAPDPVPDTP